MAGESEIRYPELISVAFFMLFSFISLPSILVSVLEDFRPEIQRIGNDLWNPDEIYLLL